MANAGTEQLQTLLTLFKAIFLVRCFADTFKILH